MCVEGVAHGVVVPILAEIDMGDLAERVNAGVGASGARDDRGLAGECVNGVGDHALDGELVVLRLPADEGGAVIFDGEFVAGHRSAKDKAARDRRSAQEFLGAHRLPAGALQFHEAHGAFAAGDSQLFVEHLARLAAAGSPG